jgi:4-amino-4-deoxy-L-arabinose transferase-like glycosyltransferase
MIERVLLAAITLAALALRVVFADQSLLGDELFTYTHASEGSFGDMMDSADRVEYTPPLYFVLAWLAAKVGDVETAIRVPAIAFGTATVPLVHLLARRVGGPVAGLVAAAAFALSPFALFYGSEARSYGAAAFFVALSALLLLEALERNRLVWWAGLSASVAAVALSHYTAIPALLWLAAWAAWARRDRLRPLAIAFGAAAAAFLVWVPFAPTFSSPDVVGAFWPLNLENVASATARSLYGLNPPVAIGDAPGIASAVVLSALALVGAAGAARRIRLDRRTPSRGALVMLAGLALVTPVALLTYSLLGTDIFVARSLFPTLPAVFAVIGVGLATLPRPALAACAVAGLAALVVGIVGANGPDARRPQYEDAAAFAVERTSPADPILDVEVFPERAPRMALEIHVPDDREVIETDRVDARPALARARRVALVLFPSIGGSETQLGRVARAGLTPVERRVFRGSVDLHVVIFERRQPPS